MGQSIRLRNYKTVSKKNLETKIPFFREVQVMVSFQIFNKTETYKKDNHLLSLVIIPSSKINKKSKGCKYFLTLFLFPNMAARE